MISGAINNAVTTFDSTVWVSEIGSDFQNRMLRSRRSSYRAPMQMKYTTTVMVIISGTVGKTKKPAMIAPKVPDESRARPPKLSRRTASRCMFWPFALMTIDMKFPSLSWYSVLPIATTSITAPITSGVHRTAPLCSQNSRNSNHFIVFMRSFLSLSPRTSPTD